MFVFVLERYKFILYLLFARFSAIPFARRFWVPGISLILTNKLEQKGVNNLDNCHNFLRQLSLYYDNLYNYSIICQ